jgi:hypothetical protein
MVLILTKNPFFSIWEFSLFLWAMTLKTVTEGEIKCFVCIMCTSESELILGKKHIFLQKNDVFANNFIIFFCDIICNVTTYLSQKLISKPPTWVEGPQEYDAFHYQTMPSRLPLPCCLNDIQKNILKTISGNLCTNIHSIGICQVKSGYLLGLKYHRSWIQAMPYS